MSSTTSFMGKVESIQHIELSGKTIKVICFERGVDAFVGKDYTENPRHLKLSGKSQKGFMPSHTLEEMVAYAVREGVHGIIKNGKGAWYARPPKYSASEIASNIGRPSSWGKNCRLYVLEY